MHDIFFLHYDCVDDKLTSSAIVFGTLCKIVTQRNALVLCVMLPC